MLPRKGVFDIRTLPQGDAQHLHLVTLAPSRPCLPHGSSVRGRGKREAESRREQGGGEALPGGDGGLAGAQYTESEVSSAFGLCPSLGLGGGYA